jgi:hypothetical protein
MLHPLCWFPIAANNQHNDAVGSQQCVVSNACKQSSELSSYTRLRKAPHVQHWLTAHPALWPCARAPPCRELQQHLSSCVAVVRSLVGHMESLCEDYGDLGRALSVLARFEEAMAARQGQYTPAGSTAVQRGADLQKLGYGALRQHSLSKQVRATGVLG